MCLQQNQLFGFGQIKIILANLHLAKSYLVLAKQKWISLVECKYNINFD